MKAPAALLLGLALAGCAGATPPAADAPIASRPLSDAEKAALGPILAAKLKDPGAAQFKWMPVALRDRDGITDYCGLVNGKNSYGGYTGYVRFYAQLRKDAKGAFTQAELRAVQQPNEEPNPLDPRWLNGICEQYGYADFAQAR